MKGNNLMGTSSVVRLLLIVTILGSAIIQPSSLSAQPSAVKSRKNRLETISQTQISKELEEIKAAIVEPRGLFFLGWETKSAPQTAEEKEYFHNDTELSKLYYATEYISRKLSDRILELVEVSRNLSDQSSRTLAVQLFKSQVQCLTEMRKLLLLASPYNLMLFDFAYSVSETTANIEFFNDQIAALEEKKSRQASE